MRSTMCFHRADRFGRGHALLQFDRALHGVDGAGELHQHAIAHHLDDAALVLCYQRLEDALAPLPQRRQRAGLVLLHEPAVTDHIGGKDGGEAALSTFSGHAGSAFRKGNPTGMY